MFADVTPYLVSSYGTPAPGQVTSAPSLRDLNRRLGETTMQERTFRPNFVVEGGGLEAWAEDCWTGHVRIGQVSISISPS